MIINGGRLVNKLFALLLYITAKRLHVKNTDQFGRVDLLEKSVHRYPSET